MRIEGEQENFLYGVRILDLADEKASFCSKLLSDLGASVIKIEKPAGDPSRRIGPFLEDDTPSPETSLFFWNNNTNKQGITLDIEQAEGKKIFLKLLKKSDVVVESFRPGYLESLGLDFDCLSNANSKIIVVSVTGFGQDGPRSRYKSCNLVASAYGGQMFVSGSPSREPLNLPGEQSSYVASLFSAVAILLALRDRKQSCRGAHIDISTQECVAATLDHVLLNYLYEGIVARRKGCISWNDDSFISPCRDGHIYMSISTQWETLVDWMDSDGMADDLMEERWKKEGYRRNNIKYLMNVVSRWTQTYSVNDLFEASQAMRFPWAPISSPTDVLLSPQLEAREFFRDVEHSELRATLKYPGTPYRVSPCSRKIWMKAPLIGEDNLDLYRDELGLSEEEIERLSSLNVI